MVMWQDLNGGRCSMGDACSNPPDAEGVQKMLMKNFDRHYTTNRFELISTFTYENNFNIILIILEHLLVCSIMLPGLHNLITKKGLLNLSTLLMP